MIPEKALDLFPAFIPVLYIFRLRIGISI